MRILWVCNTMLPAVAKHFKLEGTNKEGWLSGLCDVVQEKKQENGIELALAFPVGEDMQVWRETVKIRDEELVCYGFYEDTAHPENYDPNLEETLLKIAEDFEPDVIHCFGTEYPHTYAICKAYPDKGRLLVGIQGICTACAKAYLADIPMQVARQKTLRDVLRGDSILQQKEKFEKRGVTEQKALQETGNITGRTPWDKKCTTEVNPDAKYYFMNENLRTEFYEGEWKEENCIPQSIFVSQGDYPLKGLHYMLLALPLIKEKYPQVKVYVAGNSITNHKTFKDKLKISAYGKYLLKLIATYGLQNDVVFLGKLDVHQMKEQYLKSNLYVCCSSLENSPNSLGEAMLLGVPCVSADVGGVSGIFTGGMDGILYEGHRMCSEDKNNTCYPKDKTGEKLEKVVKSLADSVIEMWDDKEKMREYCKNARLHARETHNREENYRKLQEIYSDIIMKNK